MSKLEVRTKEAYLELCSKQNDTLLNATVESMQAEVRAYNNWQSLSDAEEKFLKQKSKVHWLKVGDRNNKFFHGVHKERKSRNSIKEILCHDGSVVDDKEGIKAEAVRFFQEFLNHTPNNMEAVSVESLENLLRYKISSLEAENLIKEVSAEEIKRVLFSMPSDKSPGPDGYTSEFYRATWSVVGKDFTVAVQSFFATGFLPKGINSTILALVPKKQQARSMRDYRPISCCNVLYKVISKILANRLKNLLPDFISSTQSAFVKNRLLIENVLLATELVKDYHRENVSQRCALKIDISKAFDSVQWSFLLQVLYALGFPERFIHWINLCISTASFSIQVNGELAGYFQSKRGLRQGCALSPYLFVICMNILSRMIDKAAERREIGFHPGCKNLNLTNLCFADDIMVFSDGSDRSIRGIIGVFDSFEVMSGLCISIEKSTIYLAGLSQHAAGNIISQFPFSPGTLPVRYLGLPLMTKQMKKPDYCCLIEQVRSRLQSWKGKFLSFAGRLQMLSSVIVSIMNFWMSAFRLPNSCITSLEKLCSSFLWSGPSLSSSKTKIAWEEVCTKKSEGGLGLRRLKEVNKVLCLKLIWRIVSGHSLWVDWIREYLIQQGSFWSVQDTGRNGSWMWRKILKYREVAKRFHRVAVGSGESVSFWHDNWCDLGRLWSLTGSRGVIDLGIMKQATIAEISPLRRRRNHRIHLLNQIEEALAGVQGSRGGVDVSQWRNNRGVYKNKFSSKETWEAIREVRTQVPWFRGVWFKEATPKCAFVTWLAVRNRLATGERMMKWNANIDPLCILCSAEVESVQHLFFECKYSEEVWEILAGRLMAQKFTSKWIELVNQVAQKMQDGVYIFLLRYTLQASIHLIWQERNCRRHGETPKSPICLAGILDTIIKNRILSVRDTEKKLENALIRWFETRV